MPYRFARQPADYSAFASGHVFHSAPGRTAFPARLADEILGRCAAWLAAEGAAPPYVLYDPCCGAGHLLAMLAFLRGDAIAGLIGSDVDPDALRLAERNLALVSREGLDARIATLADLRDRHGKASHAAAADHAIALRDRLAALPRDRTIVTRLFQADATSPAAIQGHLANGAVDLVIVDIPYGFGSSWLLDAEASARPEPPVWWMLEGLRSVLSEPALVAIASSKGQKVAHDAYRRVDRIQIGKRRVEILAVQTSPPSGPSGRPRSAE